MFQIPWHYTIVLLKSKVHMFCCDSHAGRAWLKVKKKQQAVTIIYNVYFWYVGTWSGTLAIHVSPSYRNALICTNFDTLGTRLDVVKMRYEDLFFCMVKFLGKKHKTYSYMQLHHGSINLFIKYYRRSFATSWFITHSIRIYSITVFFSFADL